ncbi:MAG: hypothetical protein HFE28_05110 [Clostridia bacterium]|jgi:hypothetical protein|nr:hypothetical protein [Clostridia bacterium]
MNIARGDLAERIGRNIERLKAEEYRYPQIFCHDEDWPGDWVGRALLALCEQYEATGRSDGELFSRMKEIFDRLGEHVNADSYCGEPIGEVVSEQQLSGNNWYIRALCAYYRITNDEKTYERLQTIAEKFLPAVAPFYERYPVERKEFEGGVSGHIVNGAVNGWRLSSDVGCAFILLDGITALYAIVHKDTVLDAAKSIAKKFLSFDYSACRFQTHATLSATRGVARLAGYTGEEAYLLAAERNFALYERTACTVNYANYNWFRRPDSWTEPCGFLDSLILAYELYRFTEREKYLQFCNRVYFNALRTAQRKNGGAGCETCLTEENGVLKVHMYEAFFCCTMRLANGLNYVRDTLFRRECSKLHAQYALSGEFASETLHAVYDFDAENAAVRIRIKKGSGVSMRLYLPEGTRLRPDGKYVTGQEGCFGKIDGLNEGSYEFGLEIAPQEETRCSKTVRFYADRLLTRKDFAYGANGLAAKEGEYGAIADCIGVEERFGIDAFVQTV